MRRRVHLCLLLAALAPASCGSGPDSSDAPPPPNLADSGREAAVREAPALPGPKSPVGEVSPAAVRAQTPSTGSEPLTVLYRVAGRDITTAHLGDFVLRYFPPRANDALTQLVDEALVAVEADREGVTVPDELVEARTSAYLDEKRREVRIQYGRDATLEDMVLGQFGRDFATYRADATRLARTSVLLDRLVRLSQLREDRAEVRVLVFPTEALAAEGVERLRAGADMANLAQRRGLAPPQAPPPLGREEVGDEALRDRLFSASPGEVLDPFPFTGPPRGGGEPRTWWQVFKVVDRWDGSAAPWAELAGRVEELLARAGPASPREYVQWKARALSRHPVEYRGTDGAFHALPGDARPLPGVREEDR